MGLSVPHTLEEELGGELDLSRRSGIACRESRVADDPERGAANRRCTAGLTEVRLVEQVEELEPQLHARAALQRDVLDDREVGVAEPRPVDRVASEAADMG